MKIDFTEDEMIDFLLMRGYILYQGQIETVERIYQNRFETHLQVVQTVFKQGKEYQINDAFQREFKQELINKLWQ